jgi:acyl-CoA synthetase (AMP-forming)/AMP-acid ligase II
MANSINNITRPNRDKVLEASYIANGYWRSETLVDTVRRRVAENPRQTLIIEGESILTRKQVWEQALILAGFFRTRGLKLGDVISFQLPNWSESVVIALAARMMGLIINPIPPIYRESELTYILNDCGSKLLFAPDTFRRHHYRPMIDGIRSELPTITDTVFLRGTGDTNQDWNTVMSSQALSADDLPNIDAATTMMVMYTSGTTGRPKGVLHSHHSYDYKARQMGEFWGINEDDVVFMPSPVTHIAGALWSFDICWLQGASTVLVDEWKPDEAVDCIESNHCTISGGATPFLQQLMAAAAEKPGSLSSLRTFFCGGTTVSPDLIKKASETFPNCLFFRAYGSTEMPTAAMGIRDHRFALQGAETDGELVSPVEIKIINDAGHELGQGEEGEILARGPELFAGYLHPEDNADCFDENGFFHMGDLGQRVYDNYLVITGRKKDIIIRSGENISPKEVEDLLLRHPAVIDVAIVAMPHSVKGEIGCAFIIPKANATIDLIEIQRHLAGAGLAKQKFPEHLELVHDLPRVPSGKIKKDILRTQAREIATGEK